MKKEMNNEEMKNEQRLDELYLVTEADLRAFYNSRAKVADALMRVAKDLTNPDVLHIFENTWDDNVGGTFSYQLEGQKLRSQDYKEKV